MDMAVCTDVRVLHSLPGRARIHLPRWPGEDCGSAIEQAIGALPGVTGARANPRTRNVVVSFDCRRVSQSLLLARLGALRPVAPAATAAATAPAVVSATAPVAVETVVRSRATRRDRASAAMKAADFLWNVPTVRRRVRKLVGAAAVDVFLGAGLGPVGLLLAGLEAVALVAEAIAWLRFGEELVAASGRPVTLLSRAPAPGSVRHMARRASPAAAA